MKKLGFIFAALMLLGFFVKAQDLSGRWHQIADTKLDGVATAEYPADFEFKQDGDNAHYISIGGRVYTLTLFKCSGTTLFYGKDCGGGYISISSGHVVDGNTLRGTWSDNNGARGDFQLNRQ